jgi:hypothetical protein
MGMDYAGHRAVLTGIEFDPATGLPCEMSVASAKMLHLTTSPGWFDTIEQWCGHGLGYALQFDLTHGYTRRGLMEWLGAVFQGPKPQPPGPWFANAANWLMGEQRREARQSGLLPVAIEHFAQLLSSIDRPEIALDGERVFGLLAHLLREHPACLARAVALTQRKTWSCP